MLGGSLNVCDVGRARRGERRPADGVVREASVGRSRRAPGDDGAAGARRNRLDPTRDRRHCKRENILLRMGNFLPLRATSLQVIQSHINVVDILPAPGISIRRPNKHRD